MKNKCPYIFTSPQAFVNLAVGFDNEQGITYQELKGEHAIWAARVPFLPAMMSDDFTRFGKQRIQFAMQRQFRFIYDLARARENSSTFELRFIAEPNPITEEPNLIDIVFLGKVFSTKPRQGQPLAERLWEKFVSNFPLEDPFNYPLEPIIEQIDFERYYEPIPFDELEAEHVLEIRKFEEMPISGAGEFSRMARVGDYIAHPFVPNTDFNPMGRFLVALAAQDEKCYVGISLRPTRMFDQEIHNVSFAAGQFRKIAMEEDSIAEEYTRTRSQIGYYVYQRLMQEREKLVMVRVHLVGSLRARRSLAEALGSEMMGNAENKYPTQWAAVQPADDREWAAALNNLRYLEHDIWGYSVAVPPLRRLRYLATAQEAYGAFRLPVPPESGYVPGILVKDEPFVAPADQLEKREQARSNRQESHENPRESEPEIDLGVVYHRGSPTRQLFRLRVADLVRHTLIAGSTGSGKSTTIKHLLTQLWLKHRIPFLVLYPVDKPDYRDLYRVEGMFNDLLVFTLGDESTSPFRFNPFEVPEGLLLKTHLSRLMRVFMAAFTLFDPLPMIYREALRRVYRDKGWDPVVDRGTPHRDYPIMSEFYHTIKEITDGLKYGREVQDNVRQASVIRIGDLMENAGHVVNVRHSMNLIKIMNQPTVMEIGRVGSPEDTALLMGFLLVRFAEEVERNPRQERCPHITVVEEAHRLMGETQPRPDAGDSRNTTGQDFANILAEVRGHGEGIIIAEQIPTMLVKGAIGNTYTKLMHWVEDVPSFELFSDIMNLNTQQRKYARTLTAGFAVVRSSFGQPVHIKVPKFETPSGDEPLSDDDLKDLMERQTKANGLAKVPLEHWKISLSAKDGTKKKPDKNSQLLDRVLDAPMQSCVYCIAYHQTGNCRFGKTVRGMLRTYPALAKDSLIYLDEALQETNVFHGLVHFRKTEVRINQLLDHLPIEQKSLSVEDREGIAYCYLAHQVDSIPGPQQSLAEKDYVRRKRGKKLLDAFNKARSQLED